MRSTFLVAALAAAIVSPPAVSGPTCAGFVDVGTADTDVCMAVEWLKNRSITLGCTATQFCPEDVVVRKHMALFMQRLGKALTPVVLYAEQPYGTMAVAPDLGRTLVCITPPHTVEGFARAAQFRGQFFAKTTAPSGLVGRFKYSTNGGATWQFVSAATSVTGIDYAATGAIVDAVVLAPTMVLLPGLTYHFGIGLDGGGQAPTFSTVVCQAQVVVNHANIQVLTADE